jgi:hypothetical protein
MNLKKFKSHYEIDIIFYDIINYNVPIFNCYHNIIRLEYRLRYKFNDLRGNIYIRIDL